jgi:hypothetical protein
MNGQTDEWTDTQTGRQLTNRQTDGLTSGLLDRWGEVEIGRIELCIHNSCYFSIVMLSVTCDECRYAECHCTLHSYRTKSKNCN